MSCCCNPLQPGSASGGGGVSSIVTVPDATLTLSAAHRNAYVIFTNAAGCTVTFDPGVFAAKEVCYLYQGAAGQVVVVAGGGATVNKPASFGRKTAELGATMGLFARSATECDLSGQLGAP